MAIVADADVLIDHLSKKSARLDPHLAAGTLLTTVVVRHELMYGAGDDDEREALRRLLDRIPARELGPVAGDLAAGIRRDLDARGETLDIADVLTAAIVMTNGDELMTRKRKHFARIPGLKLVPITS